MFKAIAFTATVAALVTVSSASQASTRLLVNCFFGPKHTICAKVLPRWKQEVEKVTDKRVRITLPATSIAPPAEQLQSIRAGIFDGAFFYNGLTENEIVGPLVAQTPFSSSYNSQANSVALWRTYEEKLVGAGEYKGMKPLAMFVMPGNSFYSLKDKPFASVDDLRSHKVWGAPGTPADLLKIIGGAVVSGPAIQMTELAQRGVVDGVVGPNPEVTHELGISQYIKGVTRTPEPLYASAFSFVISEKKWAQISPEDQAAILSISGEKLSALAGEKYDEDNEAATAQENASGIPIVNASDDFYQKLRAASEPLVQSWVKKASAKGIDGQAVLDFYRAQVTELSTK